MPNNDPISQYLAQQPVAAKANPIDSYLQDKYSKQNETTPQKKSIGEDILQGLKEVPGVAIDSLRALPSEAKGVYDQLSYDPMRALANAATGVVNTGRGIANLPSNAMQYLAQKGLVSNKIANAIPRSPLNENDAANIMGLKGQRQGDALIQSLSGYGPFGAAGEAGALSGAARAASRAGAAGAYGASQGQNPITAAALGPVTEGMIKAPVIAGKGVASGISNLKPSNILRGNISPEELMANLRATEGTSTPIGNVVGSPNIKKFYENVIANVPGSGSGALYNKISDEVAKKGTGLISDLEYKTPITDRDARVKQLLIDAKNKATKNKNDLYRKESELAQREGHTVDLDEFHNLLDEDLDYHQGNPTSLGIDSFRQYLNNTKKYKKLFDQTETYPKTFINGKEISLTPDMYKKMGIAPEKSYKEPSLADLRLMKDELYNKGQNLNSSIESANRGLGNKYLALANALNSDIENSIASKGSPELKKASQEAKGNYKEDFVQFLNNDLQGFLNEKKPSNAITHQIVNPSKVTDKYENIKNIQALLPEDQKYALGSSYLMNALDHDNQLNVSRMKTLIDSLGPRQFKHLFPDQHVRDRLTDFSKLVKMNENGFKAMDNPTNGAKNIQTSILSLLGATAGLGVGTGSVGTILGVAAPIIGSRLATKLVSSPQARKNLVTAILKNQKNKPKLHLELNKFKQYQNALRQSATALGANNNGENQ